VGLSQKDSALKPPVTHPLATGVIFAHPGAIDPDLRSQHPQMRLRSASKGASLL
jgi:hypothetical protein